MFNNRKNDPIVDSVKAVMEQSEMFRQIEQDLLEQYGVVSRKALPHEIQPEFDAILAEAKKCAMEAKKLDPVGQEDADIDNDGDTDKTDKYLHNRRKAIGAAIVSKKSDINEVSKETLTSYNRKAYDQLRKEIIPAYQKSKKEGGEDKEELGNLMNRRAAGVKLSLQKLTKKKPNKKSSPRVLAKEDSDRLEEGIRLLATHKNGDKTAKVYRDSEWEEYRVKHFIGDKHQSKADYHTNDKDDAHLTAKTWIKEDSDQLDEATWHQSKAKVGMQHPEKWQVVVDPPGKMRSGFLHKSEADAKKQMEMFKKNNPDMHKHAYIMPPRDLKKDSDQLDEKLTKSMSAGDVISDFVHSKDPKFKGKSKKERTKMALGAYYGMNPEKSESQMDEDIDSITEEIRNNLEYQLLAVYESGDEDAFTDFVDSLTEEQAEILGLGEQYSTPRRGPVSAPKTASDALKAADRGTRPPSASHLGAGAPVRNVPGTSGSGMPGTGFTRNVSGPKVNVTPGGTVAGAIRPATAPKTTPAAPTPAKVMPKAKPMAPARPAPGSRPPSVQRPRPAGGGAAAAQKRIGYSTTRAGASAGETMMSNLMREASYEKDLADDEPRIVSGVKGMKSTPFKKKFKSQEHQDKWADSEDADDHTVHRVEREKPQIKESFEQFIRTKFLKD